MPDQRREARIDVLGTILLSLAAGCFVLATSLGGQTYGWGSWQIVGLGVVTVVATALLIPVERRAPEPVLPMSLFASRVFTVAAAIGFIVGFGLFGATTYLPLFLQIVTGASPTGSGLELLPLILGLLVTSIGSGQIIARWGHYRPFPIAGTALMVVGFWRLSTMSPATSALERSLDMLILGLGIGIVMQVLVLAVQNDVDYRNLGVATSGATFFRSIGGCFGVAICGAIFSNRLSAELAGLGGTCRRRWPRATSRAIRSRSCRPLRTTRSSAPTPTRSPRSSLSAPRSRRSPSRSRGCCPRSRCGGRSRRRASARRSRRPSTTTPWPRSSARSRRWRGATAASGSSTACARQAGVELTARQCWVLARVGEGAPTDAFAIAEAQAVDPARVAARIGELRELGYVEGPARGRRAHRRRPRRRSTGSWPHGASAWPSCSTAGRPSARPISPRCSRAWRATSSPTIPTALRGPRTAPAAA